MKLKFADYKPLLGKVVVGFAIFAAGYYFPFFGLSPSPAPTAPTAASAASSAGSLPAR